jgi:hypothetical protein
MFIPLKMVLIGIDPGCHIRLSGKWKKLWEKTWAIGRLYGIIISTCCPQKGSISSMKHISILLNKNQLRAYDFEHH